MRIGPVTIIDIDQIREVLNLNQFPFEEFTTDEIKESLADENKSRPPTNSSPRYDGPAQMIFLEIPDEAKTAITPIMEKLGYWHSHISDGSELDGEDYFCPTCEHHSFNVGICPEHHIPLITSEALRERKRAAALNSNPFKLGPKGVNNILSAALDLVMGLWRWK